MKILVVDDDLTCRILLQKLLSEYGDVHAVDNGHDAVDFYKLSLDKDNPYNLICLDILMPDFDGHEVLEKIRKLEESRDLYANENVNIIMTTALGDGKNIVKAFKTQCEAYLVKPISKIKLKETLKKLKLI